MDEFQILIAGGFQEEDLVNDGWTEIIRKLLVFAKDADASDVSRDAVAKTMELADFENVEKMEQIRARVDSIVKDKTTAEALKP